MAKIDPLSELQKENIELKEKIKALEANIIKNHESRKIIKDTFSQLGISIISTDDSGIILQTNSATKQFANTDDELVGKNIFDVVDFYDLDSDTKQNKDSFSSLLTGENSIVTNDLYVLDQNKEQIHCSIIYSIIASEFNTQYIQSFVITKQKDEDLRKRFLDARIKFIQYAQDLNMSDFLTSVIDEICKISHSPIGFIHFISEDQQTIEPKVWSTNTLANFCTADKNHNLYRIKDAGIWTDCVHAKEPIIHNDYKTEKNKKGLPDGHAEVIRELVVPVLRNNKVKAIIGIGNKEALYNEHDVEIVSFLADVTWHIIEQKLINESFQFNEKWYRTLLDRSPSGTMIIDTEFKFEYVNRQFANILASEAKDIIGVDFRTIVAEEDLAMVAERYSKRQQGENPPEKYKFRVKRKDGTRRVLDMTVLIMKNPNMETRTVAQVIDITEKEKIELELEDQRKFIVGIANTAPALISVIDLKEKKQIYTNDALETLLGYSREDIDNMPSGSEYSLMHPDDRSIAMKHIEMVRKNKKEKVFEILYRLKHKNGSFRTFKNFERAFERDSNGIVIKILSVAVDITTEEKAVNELNKTTNRLSNILLAANDGMWEWHLDTNDVFFDPRYYEMAGYVYNEFPHTLEEYTKRVHPDDIDFVLTEAQNHLDGKSKRFLVEFRFKRKEGTWMWILGRGIVVDKHPNGKPSRLLGTHTDISEYKKIQKHALKLSTAIEQSPEGIVITNKHGDIEYINPSFTAQTGFLPEDVIGKNPRVLKSGHHDQEFYKTLWETILAGKTWTKEVLNRKKDGSLYWEEVIIAPLHQDNKEITHFVSIREDITLKKKMVTDLKNAKDQAEESDKLKSAFLANMSHEIRTPMNGILGFTDLLSMENLSKSQREEYIKIIKKSGDRMLNTINDIIDISKIEAGQTEISTSSANINNHLKDLYNFFLPEVENKGMSFSYDTSLNENDAIIKTDHEKLIAVITNLLKNAIKYTSKGSINFGYKKKDNHIEFYISDTGIGIPENRQNAVFGRFVQADLTITKAYEGSGLGLSISKAFVELLGGEIWMDSKPNVGSNFYFTIPYTFEPKCDSNVETMKTQKTQMERLNSKTILIAEDDESAFFFLNEILSKKVKEILLAKTGIEAVEIAKNNPHISLILMDMKMPDMDGYEATRKIREFNSDVVIVGQTAYALVGDDKKVLEAGCNEYITKPIEKNELYSLLNKYF